jgi:hypothetical protein
VYRAPTLTITNANRADRQARRSLRSPATKWLLHSDVGHPRRRRQTMNDGDYTTSSEAATWSMIAGRYPVPSGSNHIVPVDTARRMMSSSCAHLTFLTRPSHPKSQGGPKWLISSGTERLVTEPISREQQFFLLLFLAFWSSVTNLFHLLVFSLPSYSRCPFDTACVLFSTKPAYGDAKLVRPKCTV